MIVKVGGFELEWRGRSLVYVRVPGIGAACVGPAGWVCDSWRALRAADARALQRT